MESVADQRGDHLRRPLLARRLAVTGYFETVLIGAVVTILVMRGALAMTNYPQVGSGGLHIAHMLWGGLLMLAANIAMLGFVGERSRWLGALGAGIGFGLFIDELGKFITSNNDYFFQPTVGLLYIVFVLLFELLFRLLDRHDAGSRVERIANIGDALPDALVGSSGQYDRAQALVRQVGASDEPVAAALRQLLAATAQAAPRTWLPPALRGRARAVYARVLDSPWFPRAVATVFIINGIVGVLAVIGVLVLGSVAMVGGAAGTILAAVEAEPGFQGWPAVVGASVGSLAALVLSLIGIAMLRRSRLQGFVWLHRSVMVTLLLVQPFAFFADEFGALSGLAFNLMLWLGTGYVVHAERSGASP
jgi:hypothetical protein